MAIQLLSTKDLSENSGVKMLCYGEAGAGKTTLISTLPNPIIISAESGLRSLADFDIPAIQITSMSELGEAYQFITESEEGKKFDSVALDSISEIAEVVLAEEKKKAKDPRQAYGEMDNKMSELIRAFRDIKGKNVYFSAKLDKSTDEMGRMLYTPSMPGNTLKRNLPYFFDLVLAMRVEKDSEGNVSRALQCHSDGLWSAKTRGSANYSLNMWEEPNLGKLIEKLGGKND